MIDYFQLQRERFDAIDDPAIRASFDFFADKPSLADMGVAGMRTLLPVPKPEDLTDPDVDQEDVVVDGPHGAIPMRIFRPKGLGEGAQTIYYHTHGGGFVMLGGLDATTPYNIAFAKRNGCVVVGVDFRLPPEHPFPIPLEDCLAGFEWTVANAERLGGRADQIAIGGGCTGANLATSTAILARDAGGPMPAAQVLFAPVFDLRCVNRSHIENGVPGYSLSAADHLFVCRQYAQNWDQDRFDPRASPTLTPSLRGMPPTLIQVGEWDVLRDEAIQYADRLRDAGCDVTLVVQPQQGHASHAVSTPTWDRQVTEFLAQLSST